MKINKFFLGAIALSMGFASCSNEEPANGGSSNVTDGEKYVAVTIKSVGDPGSRAAIDKGFEGPAEGSTEGNITANDIRFYFFTSTGLPFIMANTGVNGDIESNMVKPHTLGSVNTDGTATELDAVLVLGTATEAYKGNRPAIMFCLANASNEEAYKEFANKRLSQLLPIVRNIPGNWSKFRMTSSTYLDKNGEVVYYTDISTNVKDTKEEALNAPADIFIERLAAKIRVKGLKDYNVQKKNKDTNTLSDMSIDLRTAEGVKSQIRLKATLFGWKPYMTTNRTYAIKNIDKTWTNESLFNAWNNADLHRCYWAVDPGLIRENADFTNNSYNLYPDTENPEQFIYGNYDSAKPTENVVYTYENTLTDKNAPASATDRTTDATAIIVKAIIKNAADDSPLDMVYWGGDYYSLSYFKEVVAGMYNDEKDVTNKATASDVTFEKNVGEGALSNTYYAKVKGDDYKRVSNFQHWDNGITSYFTNIEHLGSKFGVVRNHIYDYTFDNVIGLGVPGNDPKNPDPQKETYLAARVYCLNWHIIGNNVTLE